MKNKLLALFALLLVSFTLSGQGEKITGPGGFIAQNLQSAAYTIKATDCNKTVTHPGSDTTARTFTFDSNANLALPIGCIVTFDNLPSAGVITIAITSDTLVLEGAGTTGSRTLTAPGSATAHKVSSTVWFIVGAGLT